LRWGVAAFLLVVLGLPVLTVAGADIALNTGSGRAFAMSEINKLAGPDVHVAGLGGHFPLDVKLANVTLADAAGPYATAQGLELRWNPLGLFHKHLDIARLTAAAITVQRLPQANEGAAGGRGSLDEVNGWRADIAHLAIGTLRLPAAIAGEPVTLAVTGDAHVPNLRHAALSLTATAPGAAYRLSAVLTDRTVQAQLTLQEAPGGLIGHYATGLTGPLAIAATLDGPRDEAALTLKAGIGAAGVAATGTVDLDPQAPAIDAQIDIPALAPFGVLAGQALAGSAALHLALAQTRSDGIAIALHSTIDLTAGPHDAPKLLGPAAKLALVAHWRDGTLNIAQADMQTATGDIGTAGTASRTAFDLNTHIAIADVSRLSPGLAGALQEAGTIFGSPSDFSVAGLITGDITQDRVASGPFSLTVNMTHLPKLPQGTLTGAGALENFPLLLDAEFSADAAGAAHVIVHNLLWRSISASADLTLAAGAALPTGAAKFDIARLADLAAFSPVPLSGSAQGDFSHGEGQTLTADLKAERLVLDPALGQIDATLHASGPPSALAVSLSARLAALAGQPAHLQTETVLDLDARSATIAHLTAAWHGLDLRLTGPAGIATKDGMAVRHLAAVLNGGAITLDGTLTPHLAARATVAHLPVAIAGLFAPNLKASGSLSAQAALTGTLARPAGPFSLSGTQLRVAAGPAARLPPASLTIGGTLAGRTATVNARLIAGPSLSLGLTGQLPLAATGAMNLRLTGATDLRLADPLVAIAGYEVRGHIATDVTVTGTPRAPNAAGSAALTGGSVENIASGLNLTHITATLAGDGARIDLRDAAATAGAGRLSARGSLGLAGQMPIDLTLTADHATPVSSDTVTETISAHLTLSGALQAAKRLAGALTIEGANINIPHGLPPSVADLPIVEPGAKPPAPAAPPPPVDLDLTLTAKNKIFVRGDGLFAELGGHVHITGTSDAPDPQGGFDLIRGQLSLAGENLQFTSGSVTFNGDGFSPALDLEASTVTSDNNTTATLIVGGTAQHPTITLTSSPPLPSDEILAQLLFNQSTTSLTPFQAASLAAALAQLSGVGGGLDPLGAVRTRLGLDQLSLTGSGSGPPALQAGRYVAPGVYVGATQSTSGAGTQANVQINLYKGLKLQTSTGTSNASASGSSSVGLTYQFNY
jgi:translocation and assembly module TamB